DLRYEAQGFKVSIIQQIPVRSSIVTEVELSLQVGGISETVAITGESAVLQTQSASSEMVVVSGGANLPLNRKKAMNLVALKPGAVQITTKSETSTPRLREHFQETLVWQPQLETD